MSKGFWAGVRVGLPYAMAGGLLATSFGVLARDVGMPAWAAVVMSAIVFAGSAQIAALSILGAGGGLSSALGAAALMNSRFLPIGIAFAPSLPGNPGFARPPGAGRGGRLARRRRRTAKAATTAACCSARPRSSTRRGCAGPSVGAIAGSVIGNPKTLGLDAIYPAFFLALMIGELHSGRAKGVAAAGALIALALVPFTPPGVPVLTASLATLIGLIGRGRERGEGG